MNQGKSRRGPRRSSPGGDPEVAPEAPSWPKPLDRFPLLLRAAWRHRWLTAAVFLVGIDASAVYYRLASPVYRVEAVIAQRPQAASSALRPGAPLDGPTRSPWEAVHRRENLLALIGEADLRPAGPPPARAGLLERLVGTVARPDRGAGGSASDADPGEALVRRLDRDLEVTTADGTITVAVEWPDPEQARRVVDVAVKRLLEARRPQAGDALEEVIRPAQLPTSPIRPNALTVFGLGILASLGLALLAAGVAHARSAPAERGQVKGALRVLDGGGSTALATQRGPRRDAAADHEFQELWFVLARKHWRSLVLVPADEGESAAGTAASLADVGRQLCREPVTFLILADPIDAGSAARIISAFDSMTQAGTALATPGTGQVIVAVQPVVAEPLGIAVTKAADATVLCVRLGHTRLSAARRTIELVGRERIAGCLIVP